MKVIFLEDVPKVAKAGETKEVSDGYARNFLLRRKLALPASAGALKTIEEQIKRQSRIQAQSEAELRALAEQLDGKEITIEARAGSQERLYGSITNADIAAELERALKIVVDKKKIELGEPIHQIGSHEVVIRLGKDIVPKIKVTVSEKAA